MTRSDSDALPFLAETTLLSPGIAFHIRKLLRQNLDRLTTTIDLGMSDALDVNDVLQQLYPDPTQRNAIVQLLEQLTLLHQDLSSQGAKCRQERRQTELQIFELLGFELQDSTHQGTILIVDDTPANLRLLSVSLTGQGYEVCSAISGELALRTAKDLKPDLILLDVMMPEMDGYAICRQLKAEATTRDIPIMFISAVDSVLDKVKAFGLGAADYITKPFHIEEVLARVEHQLSLRNLQKRLEAQSARLQQEIQERKKLEEDYRRTIQSLQNQTRLDNIATLLDGAMS